MAFDLETSGHFYSNINLKGLSIAILLQLTFFFHPIVEAMLIIGANLQLPHDISKLSTGRAFMVLQNGLIYGAMLSFGHGATIEITLILSMKCLLAFAKSHPNSSVGKFAEYTRVFEYEHYLSTLFLISILHGHLLYHGVCCIMGSCAACSAVFVFLCCTRFVIRRLRRLRCRAPLAPSCRDARQL